MGKKRFIIWDWKDGDPPRGEDGEYLTNGVVGVIGPDNAYLTIYADYQDLGGKWPGFHGRRPEDLDVHERTGAKFSLSGSTGYYWIYRIA